MNDSLLTARLRRTPIGPVHAAWSARGVLAVKIGGEAEAFAGWLAVQTGVQPATAPPGDALRQVEEYLSGVRTAFEVEIDWRLCTPFQRRVLALHLEIPYGETRAYGALAARLGQPRAARAVGRAGATNPIALIIPCHRVVGADGSLRGYGAPDGVQTKAWLLELERRVTGRL